MAFNKKAHLAANIKAIRIAFTLDREKRKATEEECTALQRYCGFGGIKCILKPAEKEKDRAYWGNSEIDMFPMVADLHKLIRDNSKDEREYRQYFDSLKSSILTAFYTPPEAIRAISGTLKENGVSPRNFLEPSAGNGAFVDAFRETFPQNKTVCFEKDLLTGKVLSHLYPDDKIHIRGFEEIENRPDSQFDVIASNIPFGDVRVFDPAFTNSQDQTKQQAAQKVHNYFFLKGVETLREGGIMAFITSQGVMNSLTNEPIRNWLMNKTSLVSVIRLPNNLMTDNAGTEVGSDLIILQKNSNKTLLTAEEQEFVGSRTLSNGININNYFRDTSHIVQTQSFVGKDLYGKPGLIYTHEGGAAGIKEKNSLNAFRRNIQIFLYFCKADIQKIQIMANDKKFKSLEICTGAGGQALGLEEAGFEHIALVEIEPIACETLKTNRPHWNVLQGDVRKFTAKHYKGKIDLLAGGVPCPPFSVAGKQLGQMDDRDLFPEAIRLIKECEPKAVLLENVRGLLDPKFEDYRQEIIHEIEHLGYKVDWQLLNASDYGVSQLRPRAILVAIKKEYSDNFVWPDKSEKEPVPVGELLFEEMSKSGWKKAHEWRKKANKIAPTLVGGSKKHGGPDLGPTRARKVWAEMGIDGMGLADQPPTEDFDGNPRLTVSMTALIQGFPKDWKFAGKKTPAYRQIGNAFPPPVAKAVGKSIYDALNNGK